MIQRIDAYLKSGYAPKWLIIAYYGGQLAAIGFFAVGYFLFLKFSVVEAVAQERYFLVVWGVASMCFIGWLAAVLPNKPGE